MWPLRNMSTKSCGFKTGSCDDFFTLSLSSICPRYKRDPEEPFEALYPQDGRRKDDWPRFYLRFAYLSDRSLKHINFSSLCHYLGAQMDRASIDLTLTEEASLDAIEISLCELSDLHLTFVGGGIVDGVPH